ncbi:unnamed protein product [Tilletia controversa]|nr:unnamed protein product [Tilletia controversa]CAD6967329.1 unnamed protein product [Tilletia controversa]
MSSGLPDPYTILGLDQEQASDPRTVRQAYYREALHWHPDRALPERKQECESRFKEVAQSFELLSDPASRRAYDDRVAQEAATAEYERGMAADRAQWGRRQQQQQQSQPQQQHDPWGGWQHQHQQQQHPFFRPHFHHPASASASASAFFGQHAQGPAAWNPFGFPPSHGFAARPSADPFQLFDEMAGGRGANSIFAHHARMMNDMHAQASARERSAASDTRSSPMDDFFRDFEQETSREREPSREDFSSRRTPRPRNQRGDEDWGRAPAANRTYSARVEVDDEVPDIGRLFAHIGSSLLSALPALVDHALGSYVTHDGAYDEQQRNNNNNNYNNNNNNRFQSSFSSFQSSSSSNYGAGGPAGLVSESEQTRIVNGRRQTVRRKVDAEGNETVEILHNDGRRTVTVNGLPDSSDGSSRRERIIEL